MAKFYKKTGDTVLCDLPESQEVRYFIPERWFNASVATATGEFIRLLGFFCYAIYDIKTDKPIGKLRNFNFPVGFLCKPYKIDKAKEIQLTKYDEVDDYRILKFKKGDKLIVETKVPQMVENLEDMFKVWVITGHIPPNIDYRILQDYFLDCVKYSGNKFSGVPTQMLGIFVSELCRDPKDESKPFRLSEEKKKGLWTAYKSASVKTIPKYKSPYQAFTSETFDECIIAATQNTDKTNYSPLEKVLMGSPKEPS